MLTTTDLHDARESLEYWETRLVHLPRRAVRRRREAREMAARWRERVSAAERARYGSGWVGALTMLIAERRLPARTRRNSLAQTARRAALAMVVAAGALAVLAGVAVVELIAAIVRAL